MLHKIRRVRPELVFSNSSSCFHWWAVSFFLANLGKISPSAWEAQPLQQEEFKTPNRSHCYWIRFKVPGCIQWQSNFARLSLQKAVFFAGFFTVLTVFLNLFAIKPKPSVGSLPGMLNLLWDDGHLCHIKRMKKKHCCWGSPALISIK